MSRPPGHPVTIQLPYNGTREKRHRSRERYRRSSITVPRRPYVELPQELSFLQNANDTYIARRRPKTLVTSGYEKGYEVDKIVLHEGNDPTTKLVDGSQPSAKTPPDPGKLIYRVRGIPANQNRDDAAAFLKRVLKTSDLIIDSLARDVGGRAEKVATVRFPTALPGIMSDGAEACTVSDDAAAGKPASTAPIDIDRHFNGLTPLYTPEDGKLHELE